MSARHVFLLTAAIMCALAGASSGQTAPANLPVNLPATVRAGVKLVPETLLDGAQISDPRATSGPQLGDAMVCLKLVSGPSIAVFFEQGKVLSYRRAVAYDRCEGAAAVATVPALPASRAAAPPATRRAVNNHRKKS